MYGQLGHGSNSNEILPRQVMELMGSTVTQVYIAQNTICHIICLLTHVCYIKYLILRSHVAKDTLWRWYLHEVEFMHGVWVVQVS